MRRLALLVKKRPGEWGPGGRGPGGSLIPGLTAHSDIFYPRALQGSIFPDFEAPAGWLTGDYKNIIYDIGTIFFCNKMITARRRKHLNPRFLAESAAFYL